MEEIAAGTLIAMARVALSDPDEDYWPYRIVTGDRSFDGDTIRKLKQLVTARRR